MHLKFRNKNQFLSSDAANAQPEGLQQAPVALPRMAVTGGADGPYPAGLPFGVSTAEIRWMRDEILPAWLRGSAPTGLGFRFVEEVGSDCSGWVQAASALGRTWRDSIEQRGGA